MKRASSFLALAVMMILFRAKLVTDAPVEARATLALGFLLLAAYLGGTLLTQLRLPRITGYLLVGLCVGPTWWGLVKADEVEALRPISDAALALIALAAGGKLKLEFLRAHRGAIGRLTAAVVVLPLATVSLVTITVSGWLPMTAGRGIAEGVVAALALGTVAATAAPIVTMGVLSESGEGSALGRTVLSVSIAQDLAALLLLGVVVVLAEGVLAGGGGGGGAGVVRASVVWPSLLALAGAVAVGVAAGYLIARWWGWVEGHPGVFLVGFGLALGLLSRLVEVGGGLGVMGVAAAAGFYLTNYGRGRGQPLLETLETGSLPVYPVFFGLAGAGIAIDGTAFQELWPWALLIVGLRFWGIWAGAWWAGAGNAWMGLVSQGGMALALASVARRAFPAWGVSLEAIAVMVVVLHELVGPVLLRLALQREQAAAGGKVAVT